jgi:hypothetical protein
VEQGIFEGEAARWTDDVRQRDTFFSGLNGDDLRRAFD